MSTATKKMAMNSDKDKFISKDNDVVSINDTTVVRNPNPTHNLNPKQTENERRQTAEKRQEKGENRKEMEAFFAKELEDEIAQYPASKKPASIVDASIVDAASEESSQISEFEMSDPLQSDPLQMSELLTASKMAELITVTNDVNKMCSPSAPISVSVESNKKTREIAYDLFMTNKQLVNWKMKELVGDWGELKRQVMELINDHLKIKMIRQAQKERLCISYEGTKRLVTSYKDIGRSFKDDGSVENVRRIYSIVTGQFTNDTTYQAEIEKQVMRELNLSYPEVDQTKKGCISRLVTQRKVEMVRI